MLHGKVSGTLYFLKWINQSKSWCSSTENQLSNHFTPIMGSSLFPMQKLPNLCTVNKRRSWNVSTMWPLDGRTPHVPAATWTDKHATVRNFTSMKLWRTFITLGCFFENNILLVDVSKNSFGFFSVTIKTRTPLNESNKKDYSIIKLSSSSSG